MKQISRSHYETDQPKSAYRYLQQEAKYDGWRAMSTPIGNVTILLGLELSWQLKEILNGS
jgi:hypothetical protein